MEVKEKFKMAAGGILVIHQFSIKSKIAIIMIYTFISIVFVHLNTMQPSILPYNLFTIVTIAIV